MIKKRKILQQKNVRGKDPLSQKPFTRESRAKKSGGLTSIRQRMRVGSQERRMRSIHS